MYYCDWLFMHSWEGYFVIYFPCCFATQEIKTKIRLSWAHKKFATHCSTTEKINTKITFSWVHKHFTSPTHTLSSMYYIKDAHDLCMIYPRFAPSQRETALQSNARLSLARCKLRISPLSDYELTKDTPCLHTKGNFFVSSLQQNVYIINEFICKTFSFTYVKLTFCVVCPCKTYINSIFLWPMESYDEECINLLAQGTLCSMHFLCISWWVH